MTTTKLTYTNK